MEHGEAFPAGPGCGRAGSPVTSPSGMWVTVSRWEKERGNKRSRSLGFASLPWCFSHPEGSVMSHCPPEPCPQRRSQGSLDPRPPGARQATSGPAVSALAFSLFNGNFNEK